MAMTIQVNEPAAASMKPPLYRPPLQRSVSSQDSNVSPIKAAAGLVALDNGGDINHLLFHRSASLDTGGIFSRQEQANEIKTPDSSSSYSGSSSSSSTSAGLTSSSSSSSSFADSSSAASTELSGSTPSVAIRPPPPLPPESWRLPPSRIKSLTSSSNQDSAGRVFVPREIVGNWDKLFCEGYHADVCIFTEDGGMTAAHSFVLAASSPVLKRLVEEQHSSGKHHRRSIRILGVPYDAGRVFIRFLYSSRYEKNEMEKYALHLLALSHLYSVPLLKKTCTEELVRRLLTTDNVVDVLQLARLCDAGRLNLFCLRLIVSQFKTVVKSEGWRIMRESDQTLEQDLVGHVIEADAVSSALHDFMITIAECSWSGFRNTSMEIFDVSEDLDVSLTT